MRLLPDADLLVRAIITDAVVAEVGTMLPADWTTRLPFVTARRVTGSAIHPRFADRPVIDVQVWAADREQAADLAEDIRAALYLAWEQQTVTAHGHIAYYTDTAAPAEIRDDAQPDGLFRFQATYTLATRPAT